MIIVATETDAVCDRCYGVAEIIGKQFVPQPAIPPDHGPFLREQIRLEFLCPTCGHQFERNALIVD
jgi:hypothetical protein